MEDFTAWQTFMGLLGAAAAIGCGARLGWEAAEGFGKLIDNVISGAAGLLLWVIKKARRSC